MGWHVHFKNGKFNIWSTIVDDYVLSEWVDESMIIQVYKERAIIDAERDAEELIKNARKNNGCSIPFPIFRCENV